MRSSCLITITAENLRPGGFETVLPRRGRQRRRPSPAASTKRVLDQFRPHHFEISQTELRIDFFDHGDGFSSEILEPDHRQPVIAQSGKTRLQLFLAAQPFPQYQLSELAIGHAGSEA